MSHLVALLRTTRWLAMVLMLGQASVALAQRVQFPTVVPETSTFYTSQGAGAILSGQVQPTAVGWDPYADPAMQPPSLNPYGNAINPQAPAPLGANSLGQMPVDPYGNPLPGYGQQPLGQQPFGVAPDPYYGTPMGQQPGVLPPRTRLLQQISTRYTWLYGQGSNSFQNDDIELNASFAFPFFYQPAPIILTPGFNFHFWNGPETLPPPAAVIDLPARVYDAYLATTWKPQFTPFFGADLGVSVGVYSDFQYVSTDSFRILGRGVGVFTVSPQWQIHVGVVYVDRMQIKILPAGGAIWTPNSDARFELLFPRPKLAQRLTTYGNTDIWGYLAGEWGGGEWTIERAAGGRDRVDYSDLRLILGVEWMGMQRWTGHFEIGYVFNREIVYISATPDVKPNDTLMLRAGFTF